MRVRENVFDRLRLASAGISVVVSVLIAVGVLVYLARLFSIATLPTALIVIVVLGIFLILLLGAMVLFNAPHIRTAAPGEKIRKLEAQHFRALRAFQIEEFEDEGSSYFLELEDHTVLLSGQYPWNYNPEDQPRIFPCTEFVVRRHAVKGYTLDIVCGGVVIEPEFAAPPFDVSDFGTNAIPHDGQIMRKESYETIRDEFSSRMRMDRA